MRHSPLASENLIIPWKRGKIGGGPPAGSGTEPRPKTYLVHSKAVRKSLVPAAIILIVLKCMFYSRTINI